MERRTRGTKCAVDVSLVFKAELEAPFADHGRLDIHEFPVVGRLSVAHGEFQNWSGKALGFHFGVARAYGAEKLGAGLFKPYGINGVVDDSHLVGFCVADVDTRGVFEGASFHGLNILNRGGCVFLQIIYYIPSTHLFFGGNTTMNKLIPVLASALVLAACSSDDSTGASGPRGEQKYSRTLTKGDAATMDCKVYESDNSVTITMNMDLILYNSTLTSVIETVVGAEASSYTADVEMTGILQAQVADGCQETKDGLAAQGGKVTCTESTVHAVIDLPGMTDAARAQSVLNAAIQKGIEQCDEFYQSNKKAFVEFPGEWGGDIEGTSLAEKATSCDVTLEGGLLTMDIVYPTKSARMQAMVDGNLFAITESYTGIDVMTLNQICTNYRNDPENLNVVCSGASFKYWAEMDGETLEDVAVNQRKIVCPALLSGEMSLEMMWEN